MSSFRIRPGFAHTFPSSVDDTRNRILASLAQQSPAVEVKNFPGFIGLHIPAAERRYWSPRLFLNLEAAADGTTRVTGTYGPEMEIWAVFLYGYLITGLLSTFAGILGAAQVLTTAYPWGFWIVGAMLSVATLLYLGAQLGQKLGAWQTFQLHQAYQTAIGQPAEIR